MKPASEYLTATRQFVGDGEYWLFLPLKSAIELENRLGHVDREGRRQPKSLARIHGQLMGSFYEQDGKLKLLDGGEIFPDELNEILRFGLIGGNLGPDLGEGTDVGPQRANGLVALAGYPARPIEEVAALAFRLLHAVMMGDPAQREAMPDKAAASDAESERLSKQAGELLGPTMRKRAGEAAG
jgi:hypothetical protein